MSLVLLGVTEFRGELAGSQEFVKMGLEGSEAHQLQKELSSDNLV